jgi:very-short-patch-repair endonuclease
MDWYAIARAQHGLISHRQLESARLTRPQIASLNRRGELVIEPARRGVWRVAGAPPIRWAACWAAVLATESVLSHATAAWAWRLPFGVEAGPIHVSRIDKDHVNPAVGVRVHRTALPLRAVTEHSGFPVTTVSRTVIDCLRSLRFAEAATLFDRALQKQWVTTVDVLAELIDGPNRPGNPLLRRLVAECSAGDAESERRLHRLLRAAHITGWVANAPVDLGFATLEFDVVFRRLRLIIEVDGWGSHSDVERFRTDRTRQNAAAARGWSFLRFTWHDLVNRPTYVVLKIGEMIAMLTAA